jgi:argininosuccinate lyase
MEGDRAPSPIEQWLKLPRLEQDRRRYFTAMMEINAAHVVMLAERGLVSSREGRTLLRAIAAVGSNAELIDAHADREDLYLMVEAAIIASAGADAGGQLHIGRSRNDLTATMTRMAAREQAWLIQERLLAFIGQLTDLAAAHAGTIMAGYTHLRPAQPTTLGHYLTGVAYALRRDYHRLADAIERCDECPLGAAAFAGTGFTIDRQRTASLLGFTRPTAHTHDAVASRDGILELIAALALLAAMLARLTQDLYVWSTVEFGFLVLDPAIAGGSSIMPQKQNPNVLERVRGRAAHAAAALLDALMATKGTGFMHCQDISVDSVAPYWDAAAQVEGMLAVLAQVLAAVHVDVRRLRERSTVGFTMATEVADALVRARGIPFRTAHGIVNRVVQVSGGPDVGELVRRLSEEAAAVGYHVVLTEGEVRSSLDPTAAVARRRAGGPAPDEVLGMVEELRTWQGRVAHELARARARVAEAAAHRAAAIDQITTE